MDRQQRPFLFPAGFHGVGFLHTPERSCGKVQETWQSSWPLQASSIFDKPSQKWTKISPKPEKNLSMFWGLGGQISKKIKGHLSFCHVFLKVFQNTKMVTLICCSFSSKKELEWKWHWLLATMPAFYRSLIRYSNLLVFGSSKHFWTNVSIILQIPSKLQHDKWGGSQQTHISYTGGSQ